MFRLCYWNTENLNSCQLWTENPALGPTSRPYNSYSVLCRYLILWLLCVGNPVDTDEHEHATSMLCSVVPLLSANSLSACCVSLHFVMTEQSSIKYFQKLHDAGERLQTPVWSTCCKKIILFPSFICQIKVIILQYIPWVRVQSQLTRRVIVLLY